MSTISRKEFDSLRVKALEDLQRAMHSSMEEGRKEADRDELVESTHACQELLGLERMPLSDLDILSADELRVQFNELRDKLVLHRIEELNMLSHDEVTETPGYYLTRRKSLREIEIDLKEERYLSGHPRATELRKELLELKVVTDDGIERQRYEAAFKVLTDELSDLSGSWLDGYEKGLEEGRANWILKLERTPIEQLSALKADEIRFQARELKLLVLKSRQGLQSIVHEAETARAELTEALIESIYMCQDLLKIGRTPIEQLCFLNADKLRYRMRNLKEQMRVMVHSAVGSKRVL